MCAEIFRGPRVLLVDEDQEIRLAYSVAIEKLGYKVTAAPSERQARYCLRGQRYDLIISDLKTKDGDGEEFLRYAQEYHPRVKFLFFTSKKVAESRFSTPNFSGVISKTNPETLFGFLKNFRISVLSLKM